jgi:hypothetical protein
MLSLIDAVADASQNSSLILLLWRAAGEDGRAAPVKTRQAEGYTEITIAPAGRSADDPIEELPTPFAAPQVSHVSRHDVHCPTASLKIDEGKAAWVEATLIESMC